MSEQKKMDAELLPCPHCDGGAEMRLYDGDYFVQCVECFASTAADYQTEQAAAEKWNRRSLPVGVPDGWKLVPVALTEKMYAKCHLATRVTAQVWSDLLAAAPTVKAEQPERLRNNHGVDGHYFGKNLARIVRDFETFTPDELARTLVRLANVADDSVIREPEFAPSLPAAGLAAGSEEVEVVGWLETKGRYAGQLFGTAVDGSEPLMTVAQHNRIDGQRLTEIAQLRTLIAERDAAIEEWSGTAVQNGMEVDRLTAALSAQQSAPEPVMEQTGKFLVSAEPLRQVLNALVNAPHMIRELQATREPVALFADNPINVLIAEFNAAHGGE